MCQRAGSKLTYVRQTRACLRKSSHRRQRRAHRRGSSRTPSAELGPDFCEKTTNNQTRILIRFSCRNITTSCRVLIINYFSRALRAHHLRFLQRIIRSDFLAAPIKSSKVNSKRKKKELVIAESLNWSTSWNVIQREIIKKLKQIRVLIAAPDMSEWIPVRSLQLKFVEKIKAKARRILIMRRLRG